MPPRFFRAVGMATALAAVTGGAALSAVSGSDEPTRPVPAAPAQPAPAPAAALLPAPVPAAPAPSPANTAAALERDPGRDFRAASRSVQRADLEDPARTEARRERKARAAKERAEQERRAEKNAEKRRAERRRAAAERREEKQVERRAASRSSARNAKASGGSPRAIARSMLDSYGWRGGQFSCLDSLWQKESGWRTTANNPSSGAYGIPQALPGRKMASAGGDWRTNPRTQIEWGLSYIKDRHGSPCGAWSHSKARGWY